MLQGHTAKFYAHPLERRITNFERYVASHGVQPTVAPRPGALPPTQISDPPRAPSILQPRL